MKIKPGPAPNIDLSSPDAYNSANYGFNVSMASGGTGMPSCGTGGTWYDDNQNPFGSVVQQVNVNGSCSPGSTCFTVDGNGFGFGNLLNGNSGPANDWPSITAGPSQPPPLKPGCTGPALVAGGKAAGSDLIGEPPGANPASDVADQLRDKNVQRATAGTLVVAANSAKSLAPAFDLTADLIPYAGQALLLAQAGVAAHAGWKAYKQSVDNCYGAH